MPTAERRHRKHRAYPDLAMEDCYRCKRAKAVCNYKQVWNTRELAAVVAEQINVLEQWERPLVVYKCPYCVGFHLTKAKYKNQRRRAEKRRRKLLWAEKQKELQDA